LFIKIKGIKMSNIKKLIPFIWFKHKPKNKFSDSGFLIGMIITGILGTILIFLLSFIAWEAPSYIELRVLILFTAMWFIPNYIIAFKGTDYDS